VFPEVAEIALVAARLGQFQQLPKTRVILILNFTRPHAITYTNHLQLICKHYLRHIQYWLLAPLTVIILLLNYSHFYSSPLN